MTPNKSGKLSVFLLTMMNIAIILSIKNWTFTAEYGLASITYVLLSLAAFFVPLALMIAELATAIPELGGPYVWVKRAFGRRAGFIAIWFLWLQNVVWYPSIQPLPSTRFLTASPLLRFFGSSLRSVFLASRQPAESAPSVL